MNIDILTKTLDQMNLVFSSNEFSKKAKKNGLSKIEIDNGAIASFLHKNAIQLSTRRMWRKKKLTENKSRSEKIQEAIDLLKAEGYRVMKPISDWVEL